MVRIFVGAAATALLGALLAVAVSITALGGWTSAEALPPVTLGGTCIFSQSGSTLTLTAGCSPTSTIVIPANKIINGNSKLINGSTMAPGAVVIRTTAGSSSNQVLAAKINVPGGYGVGIQFNGPGGTIQGNTIVLAGEPGLSSCLATGPGAGIQVNGGVVAVKQNTITNVGCGSYGIDSYLASMTATSNNISGFGSDSDSTGIHTEGAGVTVTGNTVSGVMWGINLDDSPASSVKGNTVSDTLFGIAIHAHDANGGPVTVMTNTVSAGWVGIQFATECGRYLNNSLISKNIVTKEMFWHDNGDLVYGNWGAGIGLENWCDDGPSSFIQGTTITWNTLKEWNNGLFSDPIDTNGAPGTLVSLNTIIN